MSWLRFDVRTATMAEWLALSAELSAVRHPQAREIAEALATMPVLEALSRCRLLLRGRTPRRNAAQVQIDELHRQLRAKWTRR